MTHLVFVDTETTSLRADRRAWEIGLYVRGLADEEFEWHTFIDAAELDLGNADPFALRIGGFHERHPDYAAAPADVPCTEYFALREVERLTRGAHLVGAVVSFDAEVLAARMRANGISPSWHYHVIDVEALAVGYLAGYGVTPTPALPWDSHELSRACGVEPPTEQDRHTALGDARWARDLYDAVTGRRWEQRHAADVSTVPLVGGL